MIYRIVNIVIHTLAFCVVMFGAYVGLDMKIYPVMYACAACALVAGWFLTKHIMGDERFSEMLFRFSHLIWRT
ncbi:putative membrane protein [Cronobacter phage EspYZU12]|nr:putative membrane protein [Cronobacter phage EspYZU15]WAK45567.1 putative membrane protein [Cronobacter phage EspYZU14]WBF78351.1 putative membrane protein [Cronobacter phage EspYZU12]